MIFSHRLEPDHHLQEYLAFDGDDDDFIRTCFNQGDEELPCQHCGHCEDDYYACGEDEYDDNRTFEEH